MFYQKAPFSELKISVQKQQHLKEQWTKDFPFEHQIQNYSTAKLQLLNNALQLVEMILVLLQ